VYSQYYEQIHSAYSASTHSKIQFKDLPHIAFSLFVYGFILHILGIRTDSFCEFGECTQVISNIRNEIIFFAAFKGILLQKTVGMCARNTDYLALA
jgi:hypothetical protein